MKISNFKGYFKTLIPIAFGGYFAISTINPDFDKAIISKFEALKDTTQVEEEVITPEVVESVEPVVEETPEIIDTIEIDDLDVEVEPEEVIYDEYTDSYLLDKGYEFLNLDFDEFNEQNSDVIGYIDMPDTRISYKVFQKENDETNDYYLHRGENQEEKYAGSIYLDTRVDTSLGDDTSTIQNTTMPIFGHNMAEYRKDKMFRDLSRYKVQSFTDKHPYGVYYSEDGSVYALEIVAGYLKSGETDENIMVYNLDNEEVFNNYNNYINENALVKGDATLEYGDKIVNLVTCSYEQDNYRFILVCKAVKQYTNEEEITNERKVIR